MTQTIYRPCTINGKGPLNPKVGKMATPDIQAPVDAKQYVQHGKKVSLGGAIQQKINDLNLVEKDAKAEKKKRIKPITFDLKK